MYQIRTWILPVGVKTVNIDDEEEIIHIEFIPGRMTDHIEYEDKMFMVTKIKVG